MYIHVHKIAIGIQVTKEIPYSCMYTVGVMFVPGSKKCVNCFLLLEMLRWAAGKDVDVDMKWVVNGSYPF